MIDKDEFIKIEVYGETFDEGVPGYRIDMSARSYDGRSIGSGEYVELIGGETVYHIAARVAAALMRALDCLDGVSRK